MGLESLRNLMIEMGHAVRHLNAHTGFRFVFQAILRIATVDPPVYT